MWLTFPQGAKHLRLLSNVQTKNKYKKSIENIENPENIETPRDSYVMIKIIPFNNSCQEDRVFEKSISCF